MTPIEKINIIVLVLSTTVQIHSEETDFHSIFHSPHKKFDDFGIVERSNFVEDRPVQEITKCFPETPKAIANAQVLVNFAKEEGERGRDKCENAKYPFILLLPQNDHKGTHSNFYPHPYNNVHYYHNRPQYPFQQFNYPKLEYPKRYVYPNENDLEQNRWHGNTLNSNCKPNVMPMNDPSIVQSNLRRNLQLLPLDCKIVPITIIKNECSKQTPENVRQVINKTCNLNDTSNREDFRNINEEILKTVTNLISYLKKDQHNAIKSGDNKKVAEVLSEVLKYLKANLNNRELFIPADLIQTVLVMNKPFQELKLNQAENVETFLTSNLVLLKCLEKVGASFPEEVQKVHAILLMSYLKKLQYYLANGEKNEDDYMPDSNVANEEVLTTLYSMIYKYFLKMSLEETKENLMNTESISNDDIESTFEALDEDLSEILKPAQNLEVHSTSEDLNGVNSQMDDTVNVIIDVIGEKLQNILKSNVNTANELIEETNIEDGDVTNAKIIEGVCEKLSNLLKDHLNDLQIFNGDEFKKDDIINDIIDAFGRNINKRTKEAIIRAIDSDIDKSIIEPLKFEDLSNQSGPNPFSDVIDLELHKTVKNKQNSVKEKVRKVIDETIDSEILNSEMFVDPVHTVEPVRKDLSKILSASINEFSTIDEPLNKDDLKNKIALNAIIDAVSEELQNVFNVKRNVNKQASKAVIDAIDSEVIKSDMSKKFEKDNAVNAVMEVIKDELQNTLKDEQKNINEAKKAIIETLNGDVPTMLETETFNDQLQKEAINAVVDAIDSELQNVLEDKRENVNEQGKAIVEAIQADVSKIQESETEEKLQKITKSIIEDSLNQERENGRLVKDLIFKKPLIPNIDLSNDIYENLRKQLATLINEAASNDITELQNVLEDKRENVNEQGKAVVEAIQADVSKIQESEREEKLLKITKSIIEDSLNLERENGRLVKDLIFKKPLIPNIDLSNDIYENLRKQLATLINEAASNDITELQNVLEDKRENVNEQREAVVEAIQADVSKIQESEREEKLQKITKSIIEDSLNQERENGRLVKDLNLKQLLIPNVDLSNDIYENLRKQLATLINEAASNDITELQNVLEDKRENVNEQREAVVEAIQEDVSKIQESETEEKLEKIIESTKSIIEDSLNQELENGRLVKDLIFKKPLIPNVDLSNDIYENLRKQLATLINEAASNDITELQNVLEDKRENVNEQREAVVEAIQDDVSKIQESETEEKLQKITKSIIEDSLNQELENGRLVKDLIFKKPLIPNVDLSNDIYENLRKQLVTLINEAASNDITNYALREKIRNTGNSVEQDVLNTVIKALNKVPNEDVNFAVEEALNTDISNGNRQRKEFESMTERDQAEKVEEITDNCEDVVEIKTDEETNKAIGESLNMDILGDYVLQLRENKITTQDFINYLQSLDGEDSEKLNEDSSSTEGYFAETTFVDTTSTELEDNLKEEILNNDDDSKAYTKLIINSLMEKAISEDEQAEALRKVNINILKSEIEDAIQNSEEEERLISGVLRYLLQRYVDDTHGIRSRNGCEITKQQPTEFTVEDVINLIRLVSQKYENINDETLQLERSYENFLPKNLIYFLNYLQENRRPSTTEIVYENELKKLLDYAIEVAKNNKEFTANSQMDENSALKEKICQVSADTSNVEGFIDFWKILNNLEYIKLKLDALTNLQSCQCNKTKISPLPQHFNQDYDILTPKTCHCYRCGQIASKKIFPFDVDGLNTVGNEIISLPFAENARLTDNFVSHDNPNLKAKTMNPSYIYNPVGPRQFDDLEKRRSYIEGDAVSDKTNVCSCGRNLENGRCPSCSPYANELNGFC